MNLKTLTNNDLVSKVKELCIEERKLTTEILHYLLEIEKRRLYLSYGFPNLYEFCMNYLGYSAGASYRRIDSMRLLKDVPIVEEKIKEGKLSLTTASQLTSFFKQEKKKNITYTPQAKIELITKIENKSKKETEKILTSIAPKPIPKEKERILTETKTEVKIIMDDKLKNKIDRIKALLSHQLPNLSTTEVLEKMADIVLDKIDPNKQEKNTFPLAEKKCENNFTPSRYIPAGVKREVRERDELQCSFISPITGIHCGSKYFLEFDHKLPHSQGGTSTTENVRLLCREHNVNEAIEKIGSNIMQKYVNL